MRAMAEHMEVFGLSRASCRWVSALCCAALMFACSSATLSAQRWHAKAMRRPEILPPPPLADMAHMSWTRRDGAPSDITALTQTADGYLWIGSRLGLFRFDGLQFAHYPFNEIDPPLPSSDIAALAADRDGGLWIGFRLGGITYLHGQKKFDYNRASGLNSESTEQLFCKEDGSVWATADGRLMHLEGNQWRDFAAQHGLHSDGIYSLFFDRAGNLWTADKGHIYQLKAGASLFQEVAVPNTEANQFVQTPDGTVWFSDAFHSVSPVVADKRMQGVKIPGVPVLLVTKDGSVWAAHDSNGITRIQPTPGQNSESENFTTQNGLTDSQTRAMLEDRLGAVWIATARGLDRFVKTPLKRFTQVAFDYYPALIADPSGGIWLNDMDKPLMRLQNDRLSFVGEPHGSSSLFQDTAGRIVLFDQITREVFRYSGKTGTPDRVPVPEVVRQVENWCLGEDDRGALLACFEGHGLWRYDRQWSQVRAPQLPQEAPFSLVPGLPGHTWLGYSANRIVLEDRYGFHLFGPESGLALNTSLTFFETPDLMAVGGSDGLAFRQSGRFTTVQARTPGLLRGISGIVQDSWGDLWLNAASGVIRLPAAEWRAALRSPDYRMDYELIQERDGLLGTPAQSKPGPSAVVERNGTLWFATSGHLAAIDPASVHTDRLAPSVLLQSVLVNGKPTVLDGRVVIRTSSNALRSLEINYIGLDLQSPDRVVYQYLLEGQDKGWQDAGSRRQVFYTNLAPGSYTFRVRAGFGTGNWNELKTPLTLVVHPAFYQTTWFYVLCALVFLSLLWWIYRLRVAFLTNVVRERAEERALERARIARDLHDTLLQGIQALVLRFHFATQQLSEKEPGRAALLTALDQADEVIREGRDRITGLRTDGDISSGLVRRVEEVIAPLAAEEKLHITRTVRGTPRPMTPLVEDELIFIGRECLLNAIRHSGGTTAELELTFSDTFVRLVCRDDGKGAEDMDWRNLQKKNHWGIQGMRERARRLGSSLAIMSAPGMGTEISVEVSARRAFLPQLNKPETNGRKSRKGKRQASL